MNTKMAKAACASLILAIAMTGATAASAATKSDMFANADRDKNGTLSAVEFVKSGGDKATFRKIDKNRDGKLTRAEVKAFIAAGK
jgi:Ca2+-binding EF-hand superfamily protein